MKNLRISVIQVGLAALVLILCGCAAPAGPDSKVEAKRLELAQGMRSYFDKVHGDYSQLSAADKEAFVKLSGGQAKADQNWALMKNGPGAAARGPKTGE